jgi:glycine cleavage system H protein
MLPDDRSYSETHNWVKKIADDEYLIGVTPHLLCDLGVLLYMDLPDVDDEIMLGLPYGEIEGEVEIVELAPPIDGHVLEVNETVLDDLDSFMNDPLEAGWLIRVRGHEPKQFEALLDRDGYLAAQQP